MRRLSARSLRSRSDDAPVNPADPAISFVQDDLTESQSSAGTIEGDLTEMGKVYYDKETGTYYIVENQKTGDAE